MTHPELIVGIHECEEISTIPGKITVVIETFSGRIDRLVNCLFSVLLRAKEVNGVIEHIIVCVHGPDHRTGDPQVQDKKQAFLEELRSLKWTIPGKDERRDMPLTVIRVWSRVGHGQALDMAMPWIHTEAYVCLADDMIVRDEKWVDCLRSELLDNPETGYLRVHRSDNFVAENLGANKWQIHQGRFAGPFFAAKKAVSERLGVRWSGYVVNHDFEIDQDYVDANIPYDEQRFVIGHYGMPVAAVKYGQLVAESGAWAKTLLEGAEIKGVAIDAGTFLLQDGGFAWHCNKDVFAQLEADLQRVPEYHELYCRYQSRDRAADAVSMIEAYKSQPIDPNLKVVVAVCIYDRLREIVNWLRAWGNANHYGCKLAVVQSWGELNGDESQGFPNPLQAEVIKQFGPDYYLPRYNVGMDMRALKDLPNDPRLGQLWDAIIWFADDCLPMNKDFLVPFLAALSNPRVGLAGAFPEGDTVRTVAFGIKREVMNKIPWINGGDIRTRHHCLKMENQLKHQVENAGYEVVSLVPEPGSDNYMHWSCFGHWLWDSDAAKVVELWKTFEEQFNEADRIAGSFEEIAAFRAKYGPQAAFLHTNAETPEYLRHVLMSKGVLK